MRAISDLVDELEAAPDVWQHGYPPGEFVLYALHQEVLARGLPVDEQPFKPPSRVAALAERDGWCCAYCDAPLGWGHPSVTAPQVEHVIPRARQGSDRLSNLVLACGPCNHAKGTMTGGEFRAATS